MSTDWKTPTDNIFALLDCIVENIPAPTQLEGTPQMLVTSLDYSSYTGRIAVGRVHRGTLREGMNVSLAKRDGSFVKSKIKELHTFEGMGRAKVSEVSSGDICAVGRYRMHLKSVIRSATLKTRKHCHLSLLTNRL